MKSTNMATTTFSSGSAPKALQDFKLPSPNPSKSAHTAQSAPDSSRRYSLPQHFLPPSLWGSNTSTASLVESEEAARGEHNLDEATVAHRISALRQLNGATRSGHRYAKSTGARNSTFSQPVIVRTYSGSVRPRSQQRDIVTIKKENGFPTKSTSKMDLKMPPVEAFSFKGIMDEIRHGVTEDLERIAEICARSKYSLSNQYEVHMPPHGRGEPFLQTGAQLPSGASTGAGPTLQAVGSDDEQPRIASRARGGRRTKSVAYGTLETIMSSSRSSDEDKSKKRPAAEIAEEVRGRAMRKELPPSPSSSKEPEQGSADLEPPPQRPFKHVRSKSASFASMVIDNAQGLKQDAPTQLVSPTSLISQPARPQTSTAADLENAPVFADSIPNISTGFPPSKFPKPALIRSESTATTLRPRIRNMPSIIGTLNAWLPWNRSENRTASHAEGSLRDLLKDHGS